MSRGLFCGAVLAVAFLNATAGYSHTLASTIVSATSDPPGSVTITIAAEADPLIGKLEALASIHSANLPATADGRRARIESLFPTLRAHIDARVAGTPLMLELQDVAVDDTAQTEVRMTAWLPVPPEGGLYERVDAFTWRCTFIFGAYQFTGTSAARERAQIEWLQGPQTSAPVTLETAGAEASSFAPRFTRISHSLAMGALVVYVICRRRGSS
jgi:hypothetical protein